MSDNKVLFYNERSNRRRKNDNPYGEWIYDEKYHLPMWDDWNNKLVMFCGYKIGTYSLNYIDYDKITCDKCKKRYKWLWWLYPLSMKIMGRIKYGYWR